MITKVEARASGMLLTLLLDDISNGYVVQDINGLDPVKATIVSAPFANLDGAQYQSSRRETRNIVLTIGLEPDYVTNTVRDLRTNLYSFFMPKTEVSLRFYMLDGLVVDVSGRVESLETTLFSKEPAVNVSIICFDPDFVELTPVEIEDETVADTTEFLITYEGSVEAGFTLVLEVDRSLSEFTIYHRGPDDVVRSMDFAASLVADDVVTVNTNVGSKAVTLLRSSTLSSILYSLSPQSPWLELQPGDNYLRVYAVGDPIPFSITYTPRHGGL
jgi:tail protein